MVSIILIFSLFLISGEDNKEVKQFFFYIPDQEQINDYFNLFKYLIQWDENKIVINNEKLEKYYTGYVNQDSFQGLLFESFLRQTKNKKIQRQVLQLVKKNKLNDEYSQSLTRLYNSQEEKFKVDDNIEQIQYNYKEQYFDENINLFYQTESLVYNKELGLMLFENPWTNISFKSEDEKNKNQNMFFLMYGGGTNSMTIHFNKLSEIEFDDYKKEEIDKYNPDRNKNWKIIELEKKGILTTSGADKIFIAYDTGPDLFPEIDAGTFNIYLYNEKLKTGYTISYYMNFSKINNNYNLRHRIWNHLLMQVTLSFINVN